MNRLDNSANSPHVGVLRKKKRDESNTIALDGTPWPMAQEFLQMLREKRDSTIAVNEQRARVQRSELVSF
jgi:hypothetical protein